VCGRVDGEADEDQTRRQRSWRGQTDGDEEVIEEEAVMNG